MSHDAFENDLKLSQMFSKKEPESTDTPLEPAKKPLFSKAQAIALSCVAAGVLGLIIWGKIQSGKPKLPSTVQADSTDWTTQKAALSNGVTPEQMQGEGPSVTQDSAMSPLDKMNELNNIKAQLEASQQQQPGGNSPTGQQTAAGTSKNSPPSHGGGQSLSQGPSGPVHILPAELRRRLDPEYVQWLQEQSSPAIAWQRADLDGSAASRPASAGGAAVPGVDPALQQLYPAGSVSVRSNFYMPAGAEITAVTDHVINTDYPSAIRSTVVSPQELKGAKILVTYSGPQLERVAAQATTLVLNRGGAWSQYNISGVIMTDLPLLNGKVDRHMARRMVPLVVNAGLAGSAVYLSGSGASDGISTKDAIWNNMAQSGIAGVQAEITKYNAGKPEQTITVPAGQEFKIMLTQGLEIK